MISKHHDRRTIASCLALSLLVHFAFPAPLDFFKAFQLATPVLLNPPVMVDLQEPAPVVPVSQAPPALPAAQAPSAGAASLADEPRAAVPPEEPQAAAPAEEPKLQPGSLVKEAKLPPEPKLTASSPAEAPPESDDGPARERIAQVAAVQLPPLRKASEFLATDVETLSYRISMLGMPVGTAELEAKQENGEVRIALRVQSSAAMSQLYPIDDYVETRHIGGNFILCRIRQREGSFLGDRGFTLSLRDPSVFWIDRIKNLSIREPLPSSAVVDILSGFYYLRNQPLEVGKTVQLQIFDGTRYVPTTVAVLRKERLKLPGLREVDSLLLQPQTTKPEGFLRNSGAILIWLTDDEKKVPVKVETSIALGRVTAELVSAEVQRRSAAPTKANPGKSGR